MVSFTECWLCSACCWSPNFLRFLSTSCWDLPRNFGTLVPISTIVTPVGTRGPHFPGLLHSQVPCRAVKGSRKKRRKVAEKRSEDGGIHSPSSWGCRREDPHPGGLSNRNGSSHGSGPGLPTPVAASDLGVP